MTSEERRHSVEENQLFTTSSPTCISETRSRIVEHYEMMMQIGSIKPKIEAN
jgi:hypothetical protein